MADVIAVTNTSPVIALVGIGHLHLLEALFGRLVVPFEVWEELNDKQGAPEPSEGLSLRNVAFYPSQPVPPVAALLDSGERAAIAVAVSMPGAWVLLDELAARKIAAGLHLPMKGTLGVLVEAKRRGLVGAVRPLVERMVANGCRLGPDLVGAVLRAVGEE